MNIYFFDIDGTLIATGGAGRAALETTLVTDFDVLQSGKRTDMSGRTDRAIFRDMFVTHGLEDSPRNWERFLAGYLRRLPENLKTSPGRVLPGVAELLRRLQQWPNTALGLLTGNVQGAARLKLDHFGLSAHIAFGAYGDERTDRDDIAKDALAAARGHLGGDVAAGTTWVIGDTPLDVRCAKSIGAKSLAVATGMHNAEQLALADPDCVLDDLSDVERVFSTLNGRFPSRP